ncbi:hypothetical protein GCM10029992_54490 [Glycomyces albus]
MHRTTDAMTPPVKWSLIGRDFGGEFEYGSVAVVEDLEAYERMMCHPAHLELDRIGLPLVEKFMSFDITDDPDPEVGEKIAGIHRRRFADEPDIARIVSDIGEYTGSAPRRSWRVRADGAERTAGEPPRPTRRGGSVVSAGSRCG